MVEADRREKPVRQKAVAAYGCTSTVNLVDQVLVMSFRSRRG